MYFRNYGFGKSWLDYCLKSLVFKDPWKSNMAISSKHCSKLNGSTFAYLLINLRVIELEKLSLSNMQNLRTICEHIDCQSQVFSS